MAYPFAKAPTTGDIVSRLGDRFGATLRRAEGTIIGPRGPVAIRYLMREVNGAVMVSEPLADDDGEFVGWDKLRRVCRQLDVDLQDLGIPGLHLG